jgi:hypothetical protein
MNRVCHESGEPIAQKQTLPVGFRLCNQWEKQIAMFRPDFLDTQDFQRLRHIEHFRDGGRFL